VKLRVLGCFGGSAPGRAMPSFLVNDALALDAGSISATLTLSGQARVRDVLISHSHLDHTCSLPFLIDNSFSVPGFSLRIHALPEVVASMRSHLFNNHTWPDFTCLPNDLTPVLKLVDLPVERPIHLAGLAVRAVRVSHTVPTAGFLLDDGETAIAYSADTGPTQRLWELARRIKHLRAVIVETSYPDELLDLARVSGHLTPRLLAAELDKLDRDVPVYVYGANPGPRPAPRAAAHISARAEVLEPRLHRDAAQTQVATHHANGHAADDDGQGQLVGQEDDSAAE
jgi:ribonuclease BN (tRNA processing enzyme)